MATAKAVSAEGASVMIAPSKKTNVDRALAERFSLPLHAPYLGLCETLIPEFVREQYMSGTVKSFGCASDLHI